MCDVDIDRDIDALRIPLPGPLNSLNSVSRDPAVPSSCDGDHTLSTEVGIARAGLLKLERNRASRREHSSACLQTFAVSVGHPAAHPRSKRLGVSKQTGISESDASASRTVLKSEFRLTDWLRNGCAAFA